MNAHASIRAQPPPVDKEMLERRALERKRREFVGLVQFFDQRGLTELARGAAAVLIGVERSLAAKRSQPP